MPQITCDNGHRYDSTLFKQCPFCHPMTTTKQQHADQQTMAGDASPWNVPANGYMDEDKTVAKFARNGVNVFDGDLTVAFGDSEDEKTQGIRKGIKGGSPVVGWLVCVDGPERGYDYRIKAGRNFVGRSWQMDICIVEDKAISRENHASVVFDPKTSRFSLVPGENVKTYLNGESIDGAMHLHERDILEFGDSKFEFIAFCKEGKSW